MNYLLYLHILTDNFTEGDYKEFNNLDKYKDINRYIELNNQIEKTPKIWIGESILFDGTDNLPFCIVNKIRNLFNGDCIIIDEFFINKIIEIFKNQKNDLECNAENINLILNNEGYDLIDVMYVIKFLNKYFGKKIFAMDWDKIK